MALLKIKERSYSFPQIIILINNNIKGVTFYTLIKVVVSYSLFFDLRADIFLSLRTDLLYYVIKISIFKNTR